MTRENTTQRHSKYYIETLIFEVENTLFKVPTRYLFEHSEILKAASEISANSSEGHSDDNPIKLALPDDANAEDFSNFVEIVYPLTVNLPPPTDLSQKQWMSVLKLATCWMFDNLRKRAIANISITAFVDKVVIGRKYGVRDWVAQGLSGLANPANDLLPLTDLAALGDATAMRVLYLRNQPSSINCTLTKEEASRNCCFSPVNSDIVCKYCKERFSLHPRHKKATVEELFANELRQLSA